MISSLELTKLVLEIKEKGASAVVERQGNRIHVLSTKPLRAVRSFQPEVGPVRIKRPGLKNLLLDLDDTVVFNVFADRVFPQYIDHIVARAGVSPYRVKQMIYEEHYRYLSSFDPRCFDWETLVKRVAARLGVELEPGLSKIQEEVCSKPFIGLLKGATSLLKRARSLGLRVYVFSNGYSKYQAEVLRSLGLDRFFDGMLTPEERGVIKSSSSFYSGFSPADTVVIGDHYFFDVEAPSELLFDTVWVYKRGKASIGGFQFIDGKSYYFAPDAQAVATMI